MIVDVAESLLKEEVHQIAEPYELAAFLSKLGSRLVGHFQTETKLLICVVSAVGLVAGHYREIFTTINHLLFGCLFL